MSKHVETLELRAVLAEVKKAGWTAVAVDDGDGIWAPASSDDEIEQAVFAVDEAYILFRLERHEDTEAWARVIRGNSPGELIADYGGSHENFAAAIDRIADLFGN